MEMAKERFPNTWGNIRERKKFLSQYQYLAKDIKDNDSIHMSFSNLNLEVLGAYLGQKHHNLTKDIRSLKEEGEHKYRIEDKNDRKQVLTRIRSMKFLLVARNFLSVLSWTIIFALIILGSTLTLSIGLGGLI